MASRLVTIHFGGEWNMKEDGLSFLGDIVTKAFVITYGMTLNQLKEKVYSRFLVDDSVNRVKFTHLHPFEKIKEPFLVESDGDLLEFMEISGLVGVGWSFPLCVSVEKKIIDDKEIEDSQESLSALNIADDGIFATVDTFMECEWNVDIIRIDDDVLEDGGTQNSYELVRGGAADTLDEVENYQREEIRVDTSADTASDIIDRPPRFVQVDDDNEEDQSESEGDIVEYGKDAIVYDERHDKHFNGSIYVGKMFDSKEELRDAIMMLAANETFGFRVTKSCHRYLRAVCIDKRHCKWMVHSSNVRDTSMFKVTSYYEKHTCSLEKRVLGCRSSSSKIIAKKIASRFEDIDDGPSPKSIINLMRSEHFTSVTYWKAFEAVD